LVDVGRRDVAGLDEAGTGVSRPPSPWFGKTYGSMRSMVSSEQPNRSMVVLNCACTAAGIERRPSQSIVLIVEFFCFVV
jgi:hypothetical protein